MSRGRCSRTVRIMRIRQSLCCQFRLYKIIIVSKSNFRPISGHGVDRGGWRDRLILMFRSLQKYRLAN